MRFDAVASARCPVCEADAGVSSYISFRDLTWLRCRSCRFAFQYPYVSEHRRDNRADVLAEYNAFDEDTVPEAVVSEKAHWILSQCEDADGVLCFEVGPGRGQLMQALRVARPQWQFVAIEAFPLFQQALMEKGFEVGQSLDTVDAYFARFAGQYRRVVIIADNVLEHLEHPVQVLGRFANAATSFKVPLQVLVEVPNERGLSWRFRLQDWLRGTRKPPTFPGHINLFDAVSLMRVSKLAGFNKARVTNAGIRSTEQVAYVMRKRVDAPRIRAAVALLRLTSLDTALGYGYWLRGRFDASPGAPRSGDPSGG